MAEKINPVDAVLNAIYTKCFCIDKETKEVLFKEKNNTIKYVYGLNSKKAEKYFRKIAKDSKLRLRKSNIDEIVAEISTYDKDDICEDLVSIRSFYSINNDTVIIDLGDGNSVTLKDGNVEYNKDIDGVCFRSLDTMISMAEPNLDCEFKTVFKVLKKYVNCTDKQLGLFVAYMTYILAHPKQCKLAYPLLFIQAEQGSGKSFITNNILRGLLDPNVNSSLRLPKKEKDFAIHCNSTFLLQYDNLSKIRKDTSDLLCIAVTKGNVATRALYTDSGLSSLHLHAPIVINGIHSSVQESDLASRCLWLQLPKLPSAARRAEGELLAEFEQDKPMIFGCLLKLAAILRQAEKNAIVKYQSRMMDFVKWLSAMESVLGQKEGTLQLMYQENVKSLSASGIKDDALVIALEKLIKAECKVKPWSGTPSMLLRHLADYEPSRYLPSGASALTRKLNALEVSLEAAGIYFELGKSTERYVKISGKPLKN